MVVSLEMYRSVIEVKQINRYDLSDVIQLKLNTSTSIRGIVHYMP